MGRPLGLIMSLPSRHTVYLLLLVTAAAFLLSTVYLMLTRAFTKAIMHVTLILSICLNMYVLSHCLSLMYALK